MTRALDRNLTHMGAGFVLMGSWAAFANAGHPMPAPIIAGLVQGTMTAIITLGLKRMVEALANRLPGLAALVVPPVLACGASLAILSTIHSLAGTPEVLKTLAVPTTVATLYAALYAWRIWSTSDG